MTTTALTATHHAPATAAVDPSSVSTEVASEFLAAFRMVVKGFERTPMPTDAATLAAWHDSPPAPRHAAALMYVLSHEGTNISALAAGLGISLATASQVITDLEVGGLVERIEDPSDRRRTLVKVAEARRELATAMLDSRMRPVQRALARMRPADRRALVRGLELLAEELGPRSV